MNKGAFVCVGLVLILIIGCSMGLAASHPIYEAKRQVRIGMLREEALQIPFLRTEPWYHQACIQEPVIHDLFFYGSHRYDEATIVIVESKLEGQSYRVADLGTLEANAWHTAYRDCYQRDRFDND